MPLPLRPGDTLRRADVLDLHLVIADPAERLAQSVFAAVADARSARERQLDWELERESRLLGLAAAGSGAGYAPKEDSRADKDGARALPQMRVRAQELHAARTARTRPTASWHTRETSLAGPRQAVLARVLDLAPHQAMLARLAREEALRAANALTEHHAGPQAEAEARWSEPEARWSDGLYTQRVDQVWSRPDMHARLSENAARIAGAHPTANLLTIGGGGPALYRSDLEIPGSTAGALRQSDSARGQPSNDVAGNEREPAPPRGRGHGARWQA
jgi:hypothetical protein